ncbi:PP2C family protein-serine/threonine phosphatase [Lachnospiraceae bacterium C1.1]|nr:SpoIIE family protein phosphatase [Lachnospiraceae bacterium C1.1]
MGKKRKTRRGMIHLKLFLVFAAFTVTISLIFGVLILFFSTASIINQFIRTEGIITRNVALTMLEEYKDELLKPELFTLEQKKKITEYIKEVNGIAEGKAIAIYTVDRFDNPVLLCEVGYKDVKGNYQFGYSLSNNSYDIEIKKVGENGDPEIIFKCNSKEEIRYQGSIIGYCYAYSENIVYDNIISKVINVIVSTTGTVAGLAFFASLIVSHMIARPIGILTEQVAGFDISSPNDFFKKRIRTGDEIQVLQEVFIELASKLKWVTENKIAAAAENERELTQYSVYKNMKEGFMPKSFDLPPESFTKMGCMELITTKLNADGCNYFIREDGKIVFTLAGMDETGIMPTMHMAIIMAIIKSYINSAKSFEECISEINRQAYVNQNSYSSCRAFFGMIDNEENKLYFINCGARPALFTDRNRNLTHITGKIYDPLGFSENVNYKAEVMDIKDGDMIFVTNGKLEKSRNINGEIYDFERFSAVVEDYKNRDAGVEEILAKTEESIINFFKGSRLDSEVLMLGLSYMKPDKKKAVKRYPPTMDHSSKLQEFVMLQLKQNDIPPKVNALMKVILEELYSVFCHNTLGKEVVVTCEITEEKILIIEMESEVKNGKNAFDSSNFPGMTFIKRNVDDFNAEEIRNPKDNRSTTKIIMIKNL